MFLVTTLVILLGMLINPFMVNEHDEVYISVVVASVVLFFVLVLFVWKENPEDEREYHHRFHAARVSYLTGSTFLMIAMLYQGVQGLVDIWIPITLVGMFLSKLITRTYLDWKD
jgi:archaellum biogenesis protein FlaJ (TadC family)